MQAGGGRGLGLSKVSQQDLDQVRPQLHFGALALQLDADAVLCWCVQLKGDMAAGFGEALQRKLLEVESSYSQVRSRYTFIQALVRRIRGLLRQPKS